MKLLLLAAAGGAIGAAGRFLVGVAALRLMGMGFPWGTLFVNVVGSFIMGLLVEASALRFALGQEWRVFLVTGVLGGFTTFSAFSLDFALLWERRDYVSASAYLGSSVGLSLMALFAGLYVARVIWQ